MYNFDFLSEVLSDWILKKLGIVMEGDFSCEDLGLDRDEFMAKFVHPYLDYSHKKWEIIKNEQTRLIYEETGELIIFDVKIGKIHDYFKTHEWVVLNAKELNLDGFSLVGAAYDIDRTPYQQCFYCGELGKDSRKKEKNFNERLKFCHKDDCDDPNPNPEAHNEECCFRLWKKIKKVKRNKYKRIMDHPKYSDEEKKERITKDFLEFCKSRHEFYFNNFKNRIREESDYYMTEIKGVTEYEKW